MTRGEPLRAGTCDRCGNPSTVFTETVDDRRRRSDGHPEVICHQCCGVERHRAWRAGKLNDSVLAERNP